MSIMSKRKKATEYMTLVARCSKNGYPYDPPTGPLRDCWKSFESCVDKHDEIQDPGMPDARNVAIGKHITNVIAPCTQTGPCTIDTSNYTHSRQSTSGWQYANGAAHCNVNNQTGYQCHFGCEVAEEFEEESIAAMVLRFGAPPLVLIVLAVSLLLTGADSTFLFAIAGAAVGWLAGLTNTEVTANLLTALLASAAVVQVVPGAEVVAESVIPPPVLATICVYVAIGFSLGRGTGRYLRLARAAVR